MFLSYRSGTHNNQWLAIDYNQYYKYQESKSEAHDIVRMVEEYYYLSSSEDVTQSLLLKQSYVASYNVPYTPAIYDVSGYANSYGHNYTDDPRALIFDKYYDTVDDMASMKAILRYNNISDTGDYCSAIAPRCDLLPKGPYTFGAIDAKVTDGGQI